MKKGHDINPIKSFCRWRPVFSEGNGVPALFKVSHMTYSKDAISRMLLFCIFFFRLLIKRTLLLLMIFLLPQAARAEIGTGFFLSLGHLHYSYDTFARSEMANLMGEPSDLFFGVSLCLNSQFEINLIYNRSTEGFGSDPQTVSYDKDGFGLEIGKVIHVHLFKKNNFDVAIEFVGGGYGILYPFKKINSGGNVSTLERSEIPGKDDLYYQTGFYWSVSLKYLIAKKASIDIGFKSLISVKSNEFIETRGEEILLTRSFFLIGISF